MEGCAGEGESGFRDGSAEPLGDPAPPFLDTCCCCCCGGGGGARRVAEAVRGRCTDTPAAPLACFEIDFRMSAPAPLLLVVLEIAVTLPTDALAVCRANRAWTDWERAGGASDTPAAVVAVEGEDFGALFEGGDEKLPSG